MTNSFQAHECGVSRFEDKVKIMILNLILDYVTILPSRLLSPVVMTTHGNYGISQGTHQPY